jgi:hypothetical protein
LVLLPGFGWAAEVDVGFAITALFVAVFVAGSEVGGVFGEVWAFTHGVGVVEVKCFGVAGG